MPDIRPTSSLFQCLRMLTGMDREEARLAFGGLLERDIRTLEKPKTYFVKAQHLDVLADMLERVESLIDESMAGKPTPFLVTYAIDPDLAQFDPDLQRWMLFASVHRMYTARLWNEWRSLGYQTTIVSLVPPDYLAFLDSSNQDDTPAARAQWAEEYSKQYKLHAGPSRVTGRVAKNLENRFQFHKRGEER